MIHKDVTRERVKMSHLLAYLATLLLGSVIFGKLIDAHRTRRVQHIHIRLLQQRLRQHVRVEQGLRKYGNGRDPR